MTQLKKQSKAIEDALTSKIRVNVELKDLKGVIIWSGIKKFSELNDTEKQYVAFRIIKKKQHEPIEIISISGTKQIMKIL